MLILFLNLLCALAAFFLTRLFGSKVLPEGEDKQKFVLVGAIIIAILVFLANFGKAIVERNV